MRRGWWARSRQRGSFALLRMKGFCAGGGMMVRARERGVARGRAGLGVLGAAGCGAVVGAGRRSTQRFDALHGGQEAANVDREANHIGDILRSGRFALKPAVDRPTQGVAICRLTNR